MIALDATPVRSAFAALLLSMIPSATYIAKAQIAGPPTAHCHVTDGTFTACPDGSTEWSDVQPLSFPATKSFLYVNQDPAHTFIYLMYDFPIRTAPLAMTDSVHVSFSTVSKDSGTPGLEQYDILIFGNGKMQVLEDGQPTPAGRIVGAVGFGASPGSLVPHVRAELQVPLTPGPPTNYSPNPLFWSVTVPPTPPTPPDPPSCVVTVLSVCVKSQDQVDAWNQEAEADDNEAVALIDNAQAICNQPLDQLQEQLEGALDNIKTALDIAKAAAARAELPAKQAADLENLLTAVDGASADLLNGVETDPTTDFSSGLAALGTLAPQIVTLAGAVLDAATVAALLEVATDVGIVVAGTVALEGAAAAVATGTCYAAYISEAALDSAMAEALEALAADPPDPDFMVIATPTVHSLTIQPITVTSTGLSQQVVNDLNSLLTNNEQEIALLQVIPTSVNRVAGAVAAGNQTWQTKQAQAVQQYASQLISLVNNEAPLRANLANDLAASGAVLTFSSSNVAHTLGMLKQNGFPSGFTSALAQLGLDASTQASILKSVTATSPAAVALLGAGAFPAALIDPSLTSTAKNAVTALSTLAAAPSATSLSQSLNITIPGDYTASGVGLRGQTGGNITISGVPAGATVVKALLYWGMLDNGEDPSLNKLTFNGAAIAGTRIGIGPDTCWGRTNSFSYRSDVTPYVSGNSTYVLSGVANGGNILAEGASLVVIYQLAGAQTKTVMLSDGNVAVPRGTNVATASFAGFVAASPVSATTTFIVGDGQDALFGIPSPTSFTGSAGTINFQNLFNSLNGAYWDTSSFNVSSAVGTGSDSGSAKVTYAGDCLLWTAQAFSVSTTPITSTAVTTTAAVVQANPDGSTVVNGQGLTLAEAPTLQEQIQLIVQSEVIQTPSISPTALAAQLVNSLPPSILPPSQAAAIITAVGNSVVIPTTPGAPANLIVTRSLARTNGNVVVQLTITNNGSTPANHVVLSSVKVGTALGTPMPQILGTINAGASVQATVSVPSSIGVSGVPSSLVTKGTYSGGTFTASSRITLP